MYLKAMHKKLKYCYMHDKQNRKVDTASGNLCFLQGIDVRKDYMNGKKQTYILNGTNST